MVAVTLIPERVQENLAAALFPQRTDAFGYAVEREREELFEKLAESSRLMMGMAAEFEGGGSKLDAEEAA